MDQGRNLTLPCAQNGSTIMWVREGRVDKQVERLTILPNGSLFLEEANRNDTGIYSCFVDDADTNNETRSKVRIKVRSMFTLNMRFFFIHTNTCLIEKLNFNLFS